MSLVKCDCGMLVEHNKKKYCQTCTILQLKKERDILLEAVKNAMDASSWLDARAIERQALKEIGEK